jgi:hypothetical protein
MPDIPQGDSAMVTQLRERLDNCIRTYMAQYGTEPVEIAMPLNAWGLLNQPSSWQGINVVPRRDITHFKARGSIVMPSNRERVAVARRRIEEVL